jgi:hypothetical protein
MPPKTGTVDQVEDDAALIASGPNGAYVLVVMTDCLGGDAGWQLIASVAADTWTFEAARAASCRRAGPIRSRT